MTYAQPVTDPTDVMGRRIGAFLIDGAIVFTLTLAVLIPMVLSRMETAPVGTIDCVNESGQGFDQDRTTDGDVNFCFEDGDQVRYLPADQEDAIGGLFYGIFFGLGALDLLLLQGLTGASLGKLMVGLRVVRHDGRTAGLGWSALRFVLLFVDSFFCYLPGLITAFVTKGHRRIGDLAASTLVVRKDAVGTPPMVPGLTAPEGYQPQGSPAGFGAYPAQPGGWGTPPAAGPAGGWAPSEPAVPTTPGGDGPTWDAARNAYIQYDADQAAWLQWDDATSAWKPIDQ